MNILVYGAGAVGGYLGGKLALAGRLVTLVTRPDTAAAINHDGLQLTENGDTRRALVRAVDSRAGALTEGGRRGGHNGAQEPRPGLRHRAGGNSGMDRHQRPVLNSSRLMRAAPMMRLASALPRQS